jgi:DNA repair photolyase
MAAGKRKKEIEDQNSVFGHENPVPPKAAPRGRGAATNPPNRFEKLSYAEIDVEPDPDDGAGGPRTRYYDDASKSILARNDSPDIPFTFSLNPYRGCEHGCIYCYARPSHEYLGFSAGLDFETRIMVKRRAPDLLRQALGKKSWVPQMVALSGNTDCYQPVERKLGITRRCLEVFLEYRNPVSIVTKNPLVVRDIDVLSEMAKMNLVHVMVSVTSLDPGVIRVMEPRAAAPPARLDAIEKLASAGIPVGVNAAPIVPGLTDEEIPAILKAGAARGATTGGYILLRLPGAVEPLFLEWLDRNFPDRKGKILSRLREVRNGRLSDSSFDTRQEGTGRVAEAIQSLFSLSLARSGLDAPWAPLATDRFRRDAGHAPDLFEN